MKAAHPEVAAATTTRQDILDNLETFLTTTLGKGIITAKDTPNFVANRVGVAGMLATMAEAQKYGIPFDIVDQLLLPLGAEGLNIA